MKEECEQRKRKTRRPAGASTVAINSQVLIAESIIVGEAPGSYVNVPETGDALNFAIP